MRSRLMLAPLALLLAATTAIAQEDCVFLSLKLLRDGTPIGSPRLIVKQGTTGAIQLDDGFRLETTSRAEVATTELQFRLSAMQPDGKTFIAAPKMVVQTGSRGALSLSANGVPNYRIEVTPSLVACPGS